MAAAAYFEAELDIILLFLYNVTIEQIQIYDSNLLFKIVFLLQLLYVDFVIQLFLGIINNHRFQFIVVDLMLRNRQLFLNWLTFQIFLAGSVYFRLTQVSTFIAHKVFIGFLLYFEFFLVLFLRYFLQFKPCNFPIFQLNISLLPTLKQSRRLLEQKAYFIRRKVLKLHKKVKFSLVYNLQAVNLVILTYQLTLTIRFPTYINIITFSFFLLPLIINNCLGTLVYI